MGKATAESSAAARAVYEAADRALGGGPADAISRLCFEGPLEALTLTANTQPAIVATSSALVAALREALPGLPPPDFAAGHSLGEYSALCAAGALSLEDAVKLCRLRGAAMQDAVPPGEGAMAAIMGLDPEAISAVCAEAAAGEIVSPANFNAPGQIVIAGHAGAVARAGELASARGGKAIPLKVSAPFHCALMQPAEARLAPELRALPARDPRVPVIANVDAAPRYDAESSIEALIRQVSAPVRWEDSVRRLASDGVTAYVEVGPGTVLSGLIRKIVPAAIVLNLESPDGLAAIEALAAGEPHASEHS